MREEKIHRIETHAAGICLEGKRVLVIKRSPSRKLYPNLWECGGGQVEAGESFEQAVTRQLREEAGVRVNPVRILGTYEIPAQESGQGKIPGIKFICRFLGYINGKEPQISKEHTEWRWQEIDKLDKLEFIPGVKEDIKLAYSLISRSPIPSP